MPIYNLLLILLVYYLLLAMVAQWLGFMPRNYQMSMCGSFWNAYHHSPAELTLSDRLSDHNQACQRARVLDFAREC